MFQKIINFFKLDISGNRVFGLGLLRCIAILLVLLTHFIESVRYSMYLLNLFIIDNIINPYTYLYNNKNSIKFFLFFGTCFLLSTLLYKYFEVPIIKWRDRITRK